MPKGDNLSPQQELFIEEYLEDFNATQAAIRAGYSERTARQLGGQLLTNPAIRAEIERRRVEAIQKIRLDRTKFINHLKSRVYSSMGDFADWDGATVRLRSSKDIKKFHKRLIKKVKATDNGPELSLKEDHKAMEILAKHFGFTKEELVRSSEEFFADDASEVEDATDEALAQRYAKIVGAK